MNQKPIFPPVDRAEIIAATHYAELVSALHAIGVDWGPDPHKTHLALCRMRERLAQDIRAKANGRLSDPEAAA